MKKLHILVGIPCSGKSTLAAQIVAQSPETIIVNRDKFRELLFGYTEETVKEYYAHKLYWMREALVTEFHKATIDRALSLGLSVVVDDTNCNYDRLIALYEAYVGEVDRLEVGFLKVPLEVCLRRNEARTRKVPADTIRRMYENFNDCIRQWDVKHQQSGLSAKPIIIVSDEGDKFYFKALDGQIWLFIHDGTDFKQVRTAAAWEVAHAYKTREYPGYFPPAESKQ